MKYSTCFVFISMPFNKNVRKLGPFSDLIFLTIYEWKSVPFQSHTSATAIPLLTLKIIMVNIYFDGKNWPIDNFR